MPQYERKALPLQKYFAPIPKDKYAIRLIHLYSQKTLPLLTINYAGTAFCNTIWSNALPELQVLI